MFDTVFSSGSQMTFGGVMLLVAALSAGVPAQATPVHKAQVVAVAPVAKQLDRSFIGRVVVTAVADVLLAYIKRPKASRARILKFYCGQFLGFALNLWQ